MKFSFFYKTRILTASLLALFMVCVAGNAYAVCTSPAGTAGMIVYNEDDNVMQYCDNTAWIGMGRVPGSGGAGCSNPTGDESAIVYNTDYSVMQYCDGSVWRAMGPVMSEPSSSGLVAHWKFDETSGTTADDATGNTDNDGTLVGGPTWVPSGGMVGGALLFDGSDDYVNIPNADNPGGVSEKDTFATGEYQTMTMTGWVNVTTNGGSYDEITDSIGGAAYVAWEDGGASDRQLRSMIRTGFPYAANYWPDSNRTLTHGEWIHFVYTVVDGVGYKFYFDGVLDKDFSYPDANLDHWGCSSGTRCQIGRFNTFANFHGYIDDLRVYNRELTEDEIKGLVALGTADCSNPSAPEGEMVYNVDNNIMQYCNGVEWIGIGK